MSEPTRADARLEELEAARIGHIQRCHYRAATRVAAELKRVARAEGQIGYYVTALYTLAGFANALLDPTPGREAAVELIAVLESEDLTRQIQPDLTLGSYESLVAHNLAYAYDRLGHATGATLGYNSEGVHETVAEGIQVCRRTGNLEAIDCFRNYATEVCRAADDIDMALHHARQVILTSNSVPGSSLDRRWAGASDEVRLLILDGRLGAAGQALDRTETFVATFHSAAAARLQTNHLRDTLAILAEPAADLAARPAPETGVPSDDEYPLNHLRRDLNVALRSALRGDPAASVATLTPWDRRLGERHALDEWFEVRLRLVAATRLLGDERRAASLARPLDEKARAARDWLTLRRLRRLLDPSIPAHPLALAGLIGDPAVAPARATPDPDAPPPPSAPGTDEPEETPLRAEFEAILALLQAGQGNADARRAALEAALALGPGRATHPVDAARLLHLARVLNADPAEGPRTWLWAEAIAAPHPRAAQVQNLLAALGDQLRQAEGSAVAEQIAPERIERLFRDSLDLDPNDAGNFGRAASFHGAAGRVHEAERCLARLLRLDRSNSFAALRLADIYSQSDRTSDALAVLDMALRAGADDPDVAWRAGTLAHALGQFAAMLTYLDHLEAIEPGRPWAPYYRASGLLRLDRAAEALLALDEEERRNHDGNFHVLVLRACARAALGDLDATRAAVAAVLAVRLAEVDHLTHPGLLNLAERLWDAAQVLPPDDPGLAGLADRLLAAGLAPNSLFTPARRARPRAEGLNFYVCEVIQPLDGTWADSPGCLANEGGWTSYRNLWGVLAVDENAAERFVLADQARCATEAATVRATTRRDDGYTDHPGVVWQGVREPGD